MHRRLAAFLPLLLVLAACSSAPRARLIEPDFRIVQISKTGDAARHMTGPVSINYHAEVMNNSSEEIRLKRIQLESMGDGAYAVRPTTHPFDVPIPPNQIAAVEFWAPAVIEVATIVGANGPVTLRAKVEFESGDGMFQQIYVQQVNAGTARPFPQ